MNIRNCKLTYVLILTGISYILSINSFLPGAFAHEPPKGEQIDVLNAATDRQLRINRVLRTEPHRLKAGLRNKAFFKLNRARLQASGLPPSEQARALNRGPMRAFPYAAKPELKSTGAPKTITLLVDFADTKADDVLPGLTRDRIDQNIYGTGTAEAQGFKPFESMREYYRRASGGKLEIEGNVVGWIRMSKDRSTYEPTYPSGANDIEKAHIDNQALFDLVSEALDQVDSSTDFTKYDNDNDGDIDLITIMYAGPDNGWGGFWWAYRWVFFVNDASNKKFDGKRLKQFVFQFVEPRAQTDFDPRTLIHEYGHALGLPDYYDYQSGIGPDGGVGGLDIMAGNKGNHNALSRWLLDWIEPLVITPNNPGKVTLVPSGSNQAGVKAVAVFPGLVQTNTPGQELFVIENRFQVGNDAGKSDMPNTGLLVWHVEATPNNNDDDFRYDNSFTDRKLVRLVRAHTDKDFLDGENAASQDYYVPGKEFTPTSVPSSKGYGNVRTNIAVTNIMQVGENYTIDVSIDAATPQTDSSLVAASSDTAPQITSRRVARLMEMKPTTEIDQRRLDQFNSDFEVATPDELAQIWENHRDQLDLDAPTSEQTILAELLLTHWATKDGRAAVEALLKLPNSVFLKQAFPQAVLAWAESDPKGAFDWYFAADQSKLRTNENLVAGERSIKAMFRWRSVNDPKLAAKSIDLLSKTEEVSGAVQGLREAAMSYSANPDEIIEKQLDKLETRRGEARTMAGVGNARPQKARQLAEPRARLMENFIARRVKELRLTD